MDVLEEMAEEPFIITTADMLEIAASGGNGSEYVDIVGLMENAAKELREKDVEIEQLHQQNAKLVEALQNIADGPRDVEKSYISLLHEVRSEARDALAKAKGGE